MDKEVELILTKLRIVSEEKERGMYLCDKEHSKLLLDYITNLQEENEKLKEELIQEKKDFKETNDYCFELKDYKSRNEKAIEKAKELKNHIDKSGFDGMTKSILIMGINEIIFKLNGGDEE